MRAEHMNPHKAWLVDPLEQTWGGPVNRTDYIQAMTGKNLCHSVDVVSDIKISEEFYGRFKSKENILVPKIAEVSQMLPGETSILDTLIKMSTQPGTWKYPQTSAFENLASSRQVTDHAFKSMHWVQFNLQRGTPERLKELTDWAMQQIETSEQDMPIGVIPIAVATLQIRTEDYNNLSLPEHRGKETTFSTDLTGYDGKSEFFPIKIAFGDGYKWALICELDVKVNGDSTFTMVNTEIPAEFIEFLKKLPAVAGLFATTSATEVEDWIMTSTGDKEFRLNAAVDLQSLARLAGWKCEDASSSALPFMTVGAGYFRFFKLCEDFWAESFEYLNPELKRDVLGCLKVTYSTYSTLLYTLLYDTFPDGDVVTQTTRTTAMEYADFWSAFVISVLNYTVVDIDAVKRAENRQQVCNAVKYMLHDGAVSSETPYRVKLFSQLIGPWPTMMKGGPRHLQVVREHFLSQYSLMKSFPLDKFEYIFKKELSPYNKYYARFGIPPTVLSSLKPEYPVTNRTASLHLIQHPTLAKSAIKIDITTLSYKTLSDQAKIVGRPMRDVFLEWARLNVERIPGLFQKLAVNGDLQDVILPYYENVRLMYLNIGERTPMDVQELDRRILANRKNERNMYDMKINKIASTLEQLTQHKATLEQARAMMDEDDQRGFRSNRIEHREIASAVPSLRPLCNNRKKKGMNRVQPNVGSWEIRKSQHAEEVTMPPLPPGNPTWQESEGWPDFPPRQDKAQKRARSRSVGREAVKTFAGKPIYQVRSRRSPGRKSRRSSKSPVPVRSNSNGKQKPPPSATVTSADVVMEESPLRSPSILIDYPSPEVQLKVDK